MKLSSQHNYYTRDIGTRYSRERPETTRVEKPSQVTNLPLYTQLITEVPAPPSLFLYSILLNLSYASESVGAQTGKLRPCKIDICLAGIEATSALRLAQRMAFPGGLNTSATGANAKYSQCVLPSRHAHQN